MSTPTRSLLGSLATVATVATVVILSPVAASAQVRQATVAIQGMSCPFCAFGVEKRLRKVDGVASVEVAMKEGEATLRADEGGTIDLPAIPDAVRKAGFTPGRVEVVAEGTIRLDPDGAGPARYLLEAAEGHPLLLLVDLSEEQRQRIERLGGTGDRVTVSGQVHVHADELPGLQPADIRLVE